MTPTSFVSTLAFRPVDLDAHLDVCIRFGIDAIVCAFGLADRFHEHDGKGAERYVERLRHRAADLPGCLVHVWQGEEIIGLIVMGRLPSAPLIGHVSLLYLAPQQRGQGLGALLEAYAWTFLSGLGCQYLQLSASPTNAPAWKFYQYGGWRDEGPREDVMDVHLLRKEASDDSMGSPLVINPDDYLETEFGREFTPERNRQAWELAYARLDTELSRAGRGVHVYVVMGVQGAGKSRWVSKNLGRLGRRAIVFDAALPARRHREKLLAIIRDFGVPVIAVFVSASLDLALSRNASRSADKKVPEEALRSVFSLLELPTRDEGFVWSQTVE